MEEKGFRELRIDPEFKNLIRPLRREEYRQLELNLVVEGLPGGHRCLGRYHCRRT